MTKAKSLIKLSDTLLLAEHADGFWLWDKTRGMNLSIRAKSPTDAFVEALGYYQKRLQDVEKAHTELAQKVDNFVAQFAEDQDE